MQFRGLFIVATLGFFMIGCGGGEAPPKATTTPQVVVPIAVAPPVIPPIEPKHDPVIIQPLPPVVEDVVPTLPTKKPTPDPVVPVVPVPKDPEQGPVKTAKDPKDLKDPVKTPKFVVPAAVFGRSFDAWRADIKSKDPAHREKAMKMVLNFGPDKAYEALPDILAELAKHKSAPVDMSVRVNGIFAISAILSAKKEPDKKVVDDALAVFKTSLRDKQVLLRTRAAQGVNRLGPRSQELIDDIVSVAHDPTTGEARKEGIMALTLIAVDEKKKVHPKVPVELGKALDDVSGQVKLAALQGLVAIGPALTDKEKQTAVDKINAFLKKKDVDPFLQMTAHVGIMTITGKVEKVHLDPLRKILQDRDDVHRGQALQFIKMLGPKGQDILDDVLVLATDAPTWQMRKEALATAMLLSHDKKSGLHPAILPALRNALNDKAPEIRQTAMTGLVAAKDFSEKTEIKTSVASLNALLKTETEPMLEIGAHATIITLTGEITQTHMAPIVDMIKHEKVPVRLEAFRTISLGGKKAKPFALSAVVAAIRDPSLPVSVAAIDTLPSLHAFETMDLLKTISADKKSDPAVVEAAHDAFILLEEIQTLEKAAKDNGKDKTDKEKK